jgi:outer membrane murein-binding lipoprotein Lpp
LGVSVVILREELHGGKNYVRMLVFFAIISSLFILSGCSSNGISKTTANGVFHVTLSSKGKLLVVGRNEVELKILDGKGTGAEGAKIEITPWMPEHNHGVMWPPTVTELGKGRYKVVMPLTMAGHWELKLKIQKGDSEDSVVFDFPDIQK